MIIQKNFRINEVIICLSYEFNNQGNKSLPLSATSIKLIFFDTCVRATLPSLRRDKIEIIGSGMGIFTNRNHRLARKHLS